MPPPLAFPHELVERAVGRREAKKRDGCTSQKKEGEKRKEGRKGGCH